MTAACNLCVHWKLGNHDWAADRAGMGLCQAAKQRWDIEDGISGYNPHDDKTGEVLAQMMADRLRAARFYVQDGSEYRAELFTAPDFFCAAFEAKP